MHSRLISRVTRTVLTILALAAIVGQAAARPKPGARRSTGFNLFAGVNVKMLVNRVDCNVNNLGEVCVDPTNSPSIPGGFWPRGTPDQYIFNSGLQLAGVIPASAGFAWAGDTVGAYFMDPRGDQAVGRGITQVYSSIDPGDAAAWPYAAYVRDTAIYASALINRPNVSQQDMWMRAWDGDPNLTTGRTHPMGILVDQRGLAWNFPTGNEDILYFVYNFFNVTPTDRSVYLANLPPWMAADAQLVDQIVAVGQQLHDGAATTLGVDIPSGGFPIDNMYAAFFMDPDVADASFNYSTAVLPFSLAVAYASSFEGLAGYLFPPDIFGAPFAAAQGFVGVKYLKSPINPSTGQDYGLTMFSNTLNSSTGFPDPRGVIQMWRYLSGNINTAAGDNACTFPNPIPRRLCYLAQNPVDTRFFQSSGPFRLEPGQVQTIVVAYVHAAPVAAAIVPYIGGDLKPGIPSSGAEFAAGDTARTLERATGWVSATDDNGNGVIEQQEVTTVPRSLLWKSLVAQAVFDNKFLLPFAPEPPAFFLVPGDNQVTVVWEPTATEQVGDPYFAVAGAPTVPDPNGVPVANPLFDPNFRQKDVEGYRIYRGRTSGNLALIAQFDYETSTFVDYTGAIDYGQCAPELGVVGSGSECPVDFEYPVTEILPGTPHNDVPIVGNVVQVPAGGRVKLADGSVFVVKADTAVTGGNSGKPELKDNGVPFAYIDRGVINSVTYFYAVTAFDVNSLQSGPSSLESPPVTRSAVPRASSSQLALGQLGSLKLLGADDTELDPNAPLPTIDPVTGIFSGPMPPTDGIDLGLAAFISELLPAGQGAVNVTVDSIVPGYAAGLGNGATETPVTYYFTGQGAGAPTEFAMAIQQDAFSDLGKASVNFQATNVDSARAALYGGDPSAFIAGKVSVTIPGNYRVATYGRAAANGDPTGASEQTGPRWWAGSANENTDLPNAGYCVPWAAGCGSSPAVPDVTLTAGKLPGVDTVFHPSAYISMANVPGRDWDAILAGVGRAADFAVYWGAAGAVDSVVDLTHHVPVPFSTKVRASWGILNASGFAGTTEALTDDQHNSVLTWGDLACVDPVPTLMMGSSRLKCGGDVQVPAVLSQTAELSLIAPRSSGATAANLQALAASVVSTQGFMFYLNGHFFLMSMASLPASGTVWYARFFSGNITGYAADGNYAFVGDVRPPAVPGLRVAITYEGSVLNDSVTTVRKVLKFVNLPAKCVIRIYSLSGVLVDILTHNDPTGGGEATWGVRNRNNQFVASGVYFYHLETPDGKQKVGRFTVVNYAQ
jgi:hypothetical protein